MWSPKDDWLLLEDSLGLVTRSLGQPVYDFDYRAAFACRGTQPSLLGGKVIARVGAFADYSAAIEQARELGFVLIHDEAQYRLASEITTWYERIKDLTPRTLLLKELKDPCDAGDIPGWPRFVKGSRQTSKHSLSLAVAGSASELRRLLEDAASDPILKWQDLVAREFVSLRKEGQTSDGALRRAFEFRTFWWRGELAGLGHYWCDGVS